MPDRNSLLGRSRPSEKLSRQEIAALDKVTTTPPRHQPASASDNQGNPKKLKVPAKALNFHWTMPCPSCGRKAAGQGIPKAGQRLARCAGDAGRISTWLRREEPC